MSITTITCENSGDAYGQSPTYLTARLSAISAADADATITVGQSNLLGYKCHQGFLSFDTSALSGFTVTSAILSVDPSILVTSYAFTLKARLYDFGATVTTADYRAPWIYGGDTLLAHISSADLAGSGYKDFTDDALVANLNLSGSTRLYLLTSRWENANAGGWATGDYLDFGGLGAGSPAKLTIEYTGSAGHSYSMSLV